jgi:hypothetical protein
VVPANAPTHHAERGDFPGMIFPALFFPGHGVISWQ